MTLRRLIPAVLFLCAALTASAQQGSAPPASSGSDGQNAPNELSVVVGHSIVLDCADVVERVSVGPGGIAEASVISPKEIIVGAKAPGETSLIIWEKGELRQYFTVTARPSSTATKDLLSDVRNQMRQEFPGDDVKISGGNGSVFLTGTVKDLNSSERAEKIASAAGKVVNLLYVNVPNAEPQILLKVIFASVDRSRSKELGINVFSTGLGNVIGRVGTDQFSPPVVSTGGGAPPTATLSNELNLFAFFPGLDLGATIRALENNGLVQVLAEPNVLTENGKRGSLLAGGEYPYPVVQGSSGAGANQTVTIMFKEFGIRLNFVPRITPRGSVHLQVAPEVSSLDFTNAVTISGFQVPAIAVRRINTDVELAPGQSFAISGLLDNRVTETLQRIPYISSIPVLGKFFQSISRTKSNTELIAIVTPEIVQPIPVGGPVPSLKYPQPFLEPNSAIAPQGINSMAAAVNPAPTTMPVEKLVESLKPDKPLVVDGGYGTSGYSTGASSGMQAATQ